MKKIIGLIVTFTLIFQSLCGIISVSAETPAESTEQIVYNFGDIESSKEVLAAKIVSYLGIIQPDSDTSFGSAYLITRAQMAKIMVDMFRIPLTDREANAFLDVPETHEYYTEIQTVVGAGLASKADYYRPDDYITGAEFLKMLLTGMGYSGLFRAHGEYPQSALGLANYLNILKGSTVSVNGQVNRILAAKIIHNALFTPVYSIEQFTSEYEFYGEKDLAISKYFGLDVVEGAVTATPFTNLYSPIDENDAYVEINGLKFVDEKGYLSEYIGHRVIAAVDGKTGEDIAFAYPLEGEYDIYTISSEEISQVSRTKIVTEIDDVKEDYDISDADFLKNGVAYTGFMPTDLNIQDGRLELIDNDDDKKIDVVNILNPSYVVVYSARQTDDELSVLSQNNNNKSLTKVRKIVGDVSKATNGSLAELFISPDNKFVRVNLVSNMASGIISGIDGDSAIINGVAYEFTGYFKANKAASGFGLGKNVSLVLDDRNKVVWCMDEAWTADSKNLVGYVMNLDASDRYALTMRVYNSEGKFEYLTLASKIRLNNEQKTTAQMTSIINSPSLYNTISGKFIVYQLDDEGKVKSIDVETDTPLPNRKLVEEDYLTPIGTGRWIKSGNAIYEYVNGGMVMPVLSSSKAFNILTYPDGKPVNDETWEKSFKAGTAESVIANNREMTTGTLTFYSCDKLGFASVVVVKNTVSYPTEGGGAGSYVDKILTSGGIKPVTTAVTSIMYIDKVTRGATADGDPVVKVRGMTDTGDSATSYAYTTLTIDPSITHIVDSAAMQNRATVKGDAVPAWIDEKDSSISRKFEPPARTLYEDEEAYNLDRKDVVDNYIIETTELKAGDVIKYQSSGTDIVNVELVFDSDFNSVANPSYFQRGGYIYCCGQSYMLVNSQYGILYGTAEPIGNIVRFTSFDDNPSGGSASRMIDPTIVTKFFVNDGRQVIQVDKNHIGLYANSNYRFLVFTRTGTYRTIYAMKVAD